MAKRPAGRILGVLSRQRPHKKKRGSGLKKKSFLIKIGLLCLVCGSAWFVWKKTPLLSFSGSQKNPFARQGRPVDWKIVLRTSDDRPLSENQIAVALETVRESVSSGKRKELDVAARQVVQRLSLGSANISRSGSDGIVVSVSQRVPLLGVLADKPRFLTSDGVIYGDLATDPGMAQAIGPTVTGIFDHRSESFTINAMGVLDVSQDEASMLKEAAELYREIRKSNHKIKGIEFKRFRGFFLVLENSETEVALGRSPFASKLSRLHEILARLEKTSSTASRIELDYQGKAFIKEKKL